MTHFLLASDLRIGVLAALLLFLWLQDVLVHRRVRGVFASLAAIVLSLLVCFLLRHLVPQELRPRLAWSHIDFPSVEGIGDLADFRSFPSDTTTLAASLVTVITIFDRRWFAPALVWAVAGVAFPRMYVGYHYLSDILAGFVCGGLVSWLVMAKLRWQTAEAILARNTNAYPAFTAFSLAAVAHQVGTMFPLLQWAGALGKRLLSA